MVKNSLKRKIFCLEGNGRLESKRKERRNIDGGWGRQSGGEREIRGSWMCGILPERSVGCSSTPSGAEPERNEYI